MKSIIVGIIFVALAAGRVAAESNEPSIIPRPQKIRPAAGVFKLTPETRVYADRAARATGEFLAERLRPATGYPVNVSTRSFPGSSPADGIWLTTRNADTNLGPEGYELVVATNYILIRAPAPAGLFYGVQTLRQLLPPEIFSAAAAAGANWQVPCVQIEDWPRFRWRGLMLDVSRHFYNKAEVETILDEMALHKLNTFHWHLTDDQGWRIEIRKYPRLTQIGAWRSGSKLRQLHEPQERRLASGNANPAWTGAAASKFGPGGRYGGFYTRTDIREVVAWAAARHITIVPEIEMPGHAVAALAAYPQFSCPGRPFSTDAAAGVNHGIYCAGNEDVFVFLQDVLAEVFQLFPAQYVHVGGDEVPTNEWQNCPKDQAIIRREGLKDASQLEGYFMRRLEKFINARGRTLIGWSEIRDGGLAQNAVVMDWIGGGAEAARAGHDVVMAPTKFCYLDHYQSTNHAAEPYAFGGFLPLEKVYAFEPIPAGLAPEYQAHILGGQGNLWTEYVASLAHAEYMLFPRVCALAEATWSAREAREFDDFSRRLQIHEQRLEARGINYHRDRDQRAE
jgi:hexosaminidase